MKKFRKVIYIIIILIMLLAICTRNTTKASIKINDIEDKTRSKSKRDKTWNRWRRSPF